MKQLDKDFTLAELDQYVELKKKIESKTNGQFGYDWEGAEVNQIYADEFSPFEDIQIQLFKPFCVIALTLDQAKDFLEQQLTVIRQIDSEYLPLEGKYFPDTTTLLRS